MIQDDIMSETFKSLIPLIKAKSDLTDPKQFHDEVNKTFHNIEAVYYDDIHADMWQSLPEQLQYLVNDLLTQYPSYNNKRPIKVLDVGCGTGLAADLLLKTSLGANMKEITLLDTSSVMLTYAAKRAARWDAAIVIVEGELQALHQKFDLILVSSVLHHIPDLKCFVQQLSDRLDKGGILLTIHDPLQEAIASEVYTNRCSEHLQVMRKKRNRLLLRIYNGLKRRLMPYREPDYIAEVNNALLKNDTIHTSLTEIEMWSVTDIHVEGLPFSSQPGISINWLISTLPELKLVNYRTYGFFGTLHHNLYPLYREKETQLAVTEDKNGRNFGTLWIKS